MTDQTRELFEQSGNQFIAALAKLDPILAGELRQLEFTKLAEAISIEGVLAARENPYSKNVDLEIDDPALRRAIRAAQPACVRLGNGSGVNLSPKGRILTAAHVVDRIGRKLSAEFPDGRKFTAKCVAIDDRLDLALCEISTDEILPSATVSAVAPHPGSVVVCIGQPGTTTPRGTATGYQPFHVSMGTIRGFLEDPLADQRLGRTKHDAWTYWGHSGSPLFNEHGRIVAMHNSWDSTTAMRHAVTHQAIVKFLNSYELDD